LLLPAILADVYFTDVKIYGWGCSMRLRCCRCDLSLPE